MTKAEAKRAAWSLILSLVSADLEDGDAVDQRYHGIDANRVNEAIEQCLREIAFKATR